MRKSMLDSRSMFEPRTTRNTRPVQTSNWLAARRAFTSVLLFSATAFAGLSGSAICAYGQFEARPAVSSRLSANVLSEDHSPLNLSEAAGKSSVGLSSSSVSAETSPDSSAPDPTGSPSPSGQAATLPEAPRSQRYPLPGQTAPVLTAGDKVRMGVTGAFSYTTIIGWVASAGYEQATNGSPNWGTDRGAFGQRLWCSALRATSENLFADSVFAPILHEDPRYYRLGSTHKFLPRLVYSATRSIITRSDSGATVPNLSQIFGNAAGSALTYAYYPQVNRSAKDTAETFGGSVGGTALGDVIAEFFGGILFKHTK